MTSGMSTMAVRSGSSVTNLKTLSISLNTLILVPFGFCIKVFFILYTNVVFIFLRTCTVESKHAIPYIRVLSVDITVLTGW